MSHGVSCRSVGGSIACSTYGILFFGAPQQVDKSLNNLASASADDEAFSNESPEMQALKCDFRWLQESNIVYSQICSRFVTKYFVETADDNSAVCFFLHADIVIINLTSPREGQDMEKITRISEILV